MNVKFLKRLTMLVLLFYVFSTGANYSKIEVYANNVKTEVTDEFIIEADNYERMRNNRLRIVTQEVDIINPILDFTTLKVNQKTAVPGDEIVVSVKGSDDDSGVDYVAFLLESENGVKNIGRVYHADEEGYYNYFINVDENTQTGKWSVYSLQIFDKNQNYTVYTDWSYDFSAAEFIVDNPGADSTNPILDFTTLKVNQKIAVPGDKIIVSVKGSDDDSGVDYVAFLLESENGVKNIGRVYHADEEGYYNYSINVDENTQTGKWSVYSLQIFDKNQNHTVYTDWSYDFSAADFMVDNPGADSTNPILDFTTLKVNQKTAVPGDKIIVSVKGSDDDSGVDYVAFLLESENGVKNIGRVYHADEEGYYNYFINVDENTQTGKWSVYSLQIFDKNQNYTVYTDWSYDFSAADFSVLDINAKVIESVKITKLPDKREYIVGQALDITGLEVTGTYNDGSTQIMDITIEDIKEFDSSLPEVGQVVTVNIEGRTATFTVDIIASSLESIEITKQPTDLEYVVGQALDLTGLEVTGTNNDGSTEILDINISNISGFDSSLPEINQVVTVTVSGKTAMFTVDITAKTLAAIEITKQPTNLEYVVGQALDLTGLEVTGTNNDGSTEILDIDISNISGFDSSLPAISQVVTVTVNGKTVTFTVDITAKTLASIEISKLPYILEYVVGQTLDLTGLEVTGIYTDGSIQVMDITMAYISGFDSSVAITGQEITVSVNGKSTTFTVDIMERVAVKYRTHVQYEGWQDFKQDGEMAGTESNGLRLEGIEISIEGNSNLGISYTTHVQNIGWQNYVTDGLMSGTEGRALRLEAIKIELTGKDSENYDVYYRVHTQNIGWMGWAKNGHAAGSSGYAYRLEGIEIRLVERGTDPNLSMDNSYVSTVGVSDVNYRTHVQDFGWQDFVTEGSMSGTSGKSLRLEGIEVKLGDHLPSGSIEYSTHIQNVGWQDYTKDGVMSGTEGRGLRLEAIRIRLTGGVADYYDVYYRVHAQNIGWMGWAKNGGNAGTSGYAYRLEAIEIVIVPKGVLPPGATSNEYLSSLN